MCDRLPSERVHFECPVVDVDPLGRTLGFADGRRISYDILVSTMPLDWLLRILHGRPDLAHHASLFVHSSSHIIGVGLAGQPPECLRTKSWMYFPEDDVPFYRATVFSNYSPQNVRQPGLQWSLMAEVSESPDKPVDQSTVVEQVVAGFHACGLIDDTLVVNRWHRRLEYGYPTPWRGRDTVLQTVDAELRRLGIFSRGRFGAWKYEVSNQDHSLMQGVEAIDHILLGADERTYYGQVTD